MKDFTKLEMDFSELSHNKQFTQSQSSKHKTVDERAYELCKKDIYAFSFVTLYLSNCINIELKQNPSSVFALIDDRLKKILQTLSEKYPSNPNPLKVLSKDQTRVKLLIDDSHTKGKVLILTIDFQLKDSVGQKVAKIEQHVVNRAKLAKSNKVKFDKYIKPICQKYGHCYQSGLKIRKDTCEDRISKFRAFQKVVLKKQNAQFKKLFQQDKQIIVDKFKKTQNCNEFNQVYAFSMLCFQAFHQKRLQCALSSKTTVDSDVLDLLRGKAIFNTPSEIRTSVNQIYMKFKQMNKVQYSILQYEDRLEEKTKHFQLNLLINGTLGKLLLSLPLQKCANEFNHKLYELQRSKDLTRLNTLMAFNEQLASKFFTNELELSYYSVEKSKVEKKQEEKNLSQDLQNILREFEKLLMKNVKNYSDKKGGWDKLIFSKDRQNSNNIIEHLLQEAESFITMGYNEKKSFQRDLRKSNQSLYVK